MSASAAARGDTSDGSKHPALCTLWDKYNIAAKCEIGAKSDIVRSFVP